MNQIIDSAVSLVKRYLPEILITMGVSGVVAGTVVACKETKHVDPILEEHKETIEEIKEKTEKGYIYDPEMDAKIEYTEKDSRKDITTAYFRTGYKLVKLYLPAGLLIGGSIGCIIGSHGIMAKRNAGLSAAYLGLSKTFENYRSNIVEKFGENADVEARYNVKAKKIKGKDGEEDSVEYKSTDKTFDPNDDLTRFFDSDSNYWDRCVSTNLMIINSAKRNIRRKLKRRKSHRVSLNEIYAELDLRPDYEKGDVIGAIFRPGVEGNTFDECGDPDNFDILVYVITPTGEKLRKPVETAISDGDSLDPVMLLDFVGIEPLVYR